MAKRIILNLLILLFTISLFAQTEQNDRVLKVGVESDIEAFSPWESMYTVRHKILWNIYETLVILDEQTTQIKPNLAISWDVRNNNRTWILKLRKGIKFHDGRYLTAYDVVASASLFREFDAIVEKVDRYTVRFTLAEPNSGFLHNLAHIMYAIAPSRSIEKYKSLQKKGKLEEFIPMGSGPFRFSYYVKGKKIVLESFNNYWQGTPRLKKLIYQIIPDNKVRLSAIENGEIDLIDVLYPEDLVQIKRNPDLKILSMYGMNICLIALNTTHKPLDIIKVRQAICLSIDKMRLAQMFYYGGYGVSTNRILSPAFWGFSALPSPYRYKPAEAKRMLAEAGYKTGLTLKLTCIPRVRPYLPDPKGMAEEIKKQLAKAGVEIKIKIPANYAEFVSIITKGDFDMSLAGWINETGNPDYTLSSLLSVKDYSTNESRWHNSIFNKKLQAARELPISDMSGRIRLYNEAQKVCQEEAPLIPLFHTKIFVIHNRRVKGVILYPSSMISYHKARWKS